MGKLEFNAAKVYNTFNSTVKDLETRKLNNFELRVLINLLFRELDLREVDALILNTNVVKSNAKNHIDGVG